MDIVETLFEFLKLVAILAVTVWVAYIVVYLLATLITVMFFAAAAAVIIM